MEIQQNNSIEIPKIYTYFYEYYIKKENIDYSIELSDFYSNFNSTNIFNYIIDINNLKNTNLHRNRYQTLLYKIYNYNLTEQEIVNYINNDDETIRDLFLNKYHYPFPLTIDDIFRGSEYFIHLILLYDKFKFIDFFSTEKTNINQVKSGEITKSIERGNNLFIYILVIVIILLLYFFVIKK